MSSVKDCRKQYTDPICKSKCYSKDVYEKYCEKRKNNVRFEAADIYAALKDAVVSIFTEVTECEPEPIPPRKSGPVPIPPDEEFPGPVLLERKQVRKEGTGFFIDKLTIVTSAHLVLFEEGGYRTRVPKSSTYPLSRVEKIFVRVNNVNGRGKNYFYEASLCGVSGINDIAVIQIDCTKGKNLCLPEIKDHPTFRWGKSRDTAIGEIAYMLGDSVHNDDIGIRQGNVVDNKFNYGLTQMEASQFKMLHSRFEGILISGAPHKARSGSPILNQYGRVIGVLTRKVDGDTLGVAQHIAGRVVRAFAEGPRKCLGGHLENVPDQLCNYYRYAMGWLGIYYHPFDIDDLFIYPDSKYVIQKGFIIDEMDHDGPVAKVLVDLGHVCDNDVYLFTSINGCDLGMADNQIGFSAILAFMIPGQTVTIGYRLASENFEHCYQVTFCVGGVPYEEDVPFPWRGLSAAVNISDDEDDAIEGLIEAAVELQDQVDPV